MKDSSRGRCLELYREYLPSLPDFPRCLGLLLGKVLVCHCEPGVSCHADLLVEACDLYFGSGGSTFSIIKAELPWTPEEFVAQALSARHPFASLSCHDALLRNFFDLATQGPSAVADLRAANLKKWQARAKQLEADECRLRAAAHPDLSTALAGKNLILFKELLLATSFPGAERLVDSMAKGFSVAGRVPATGIFPRRPLEAKSDLASLKRGARASQDLVFAAIRSAPREPDMDTEVYGKTLDEVEKGWLRGPVSRDQLDAKYGWWVPAKRFGIRQGDKVRVIDDYSICGHNDCTAVEEKVDVGGVDVIVNAAKAMMTTVVLGGRNVEVHLSTGATLRGTRSGDLARLGPKPMRGRMWDLASAYRQLGREPGQANLAIVGVRNPNSDAVEFFEQLALPFGSTAAVYHFNWVARALWWVLAHEFLICVAHYFDDFSVIELDCLTDSAEVTVQGVFDLLGWPLKALGGFAPTFHPLGVTVSFDGVVGGEIIVSNRESRIDELGRFVDGLRGRGGITRQEARQFRGRFVFARGQVFAKCGAHALHLVGAVADGSDCRGPAFGRILEACSELHSLLVSSPPRRVLADYRDPIIILVDGACEPGEGDLPEVSVGACLFARGRSGGPEFFGVSVGPRLLATWADSASAQVIGQAELLPVLLAASTWSHILAQKPVVVFIDNDSARHGLINGYSPVRRSAAMIAAATRLFSTLGSHVWYGRVPTASNLADAPSRLDFSRLRAWKGSQEVSPHWLGARGPSMWECLRKQLR